MHRADIEKILDQLKPSIPKIVVMLVTRKKPADDRAALKGFLQDWISHKKEDATWRELIRKIETIDEQAAKKIKTMRCPADQEQDNIGVNTICKFVCKNHDCADFKFEIIILLISLGGISESTCAPNIPETFVYLARCNKYE